MYPFLLPEVFGYTIPLYDIMILIGVFLMLLFVAKRFETKDGLTRKQTNRLLVLLVISLLFALFSSYLIDGIFHSIQAGEADFGTISFLGGLIGGIGLFMILLHFFYKEENKNVRQIMNTVIPGVVLAHAFGRIGCFFAGCCFGVPTESYLGVVFPSGAAHIEYGDQAIFPTQLFESAFLFILFFTLTNIERLRHFELESYLIGYGVWRIAIEFIRGDDRGAVFPLWTTTYNVFPTPSQFMSLFMVLLGVYFLYRHLNLKSIKHNQKQTA